MPTKIQASGFFQNSQFFWVEMKKINFITFQGWLKFPKLPEMFPSILGKKIS